MKPKPIVKAGLPISIFDVNKMVSGCLLQESISDFGIDVLEPNTIYTIIFEYPLENPAKTSFITGKFCWTQSHLIKEICSALFKIYLDTDKYGAKKCSIEKLFLEQVSVNNYTKEIKLAISNK